MRRLSILWVLFALFGFGCGGTDASNPDDLTIDNDDPAALADSAATPSGTFKYQDAVAGEFEQLVIKTDKTFHGELRVYCINGPCHPITQDGTYRFTKSGSTRYIRFYDANGDKVARMAYKMTGTKLSLRNADQNGSDWYKMTRATEAWCQDVSDCSVQGMMTPKCAGQWTCSSSNTCDYQCGVQQNACEQAGGNCVGLYPDACENGIVGDANTFSCGGGLGVECCLPLPKAPVCKYAGTSREGWYDADSGDKLCAANCSGATAKCSNTGTRSEGWYTDSGAGCGGGSLVTWETCGK